MRSKFENLDFLRDCQLWDTDFRRNLVIEAFKNLIFGVQAFLKPEFL